MRHNLKTLSVSASFFFILVALNMLISPALAVDETFTIPDHVTRGESFYLCGEIPLDIECMPDTDTISYAYGSSDGDLTKNESELGVTKDILCAELTTENYNTDYPADSVEITLYNTGYCNIDYISYPVTFLEFSSSNNQARLSINGNVAWYGSGETFTIDSGTNAHFKLEEIIETTTTAYINVTCDSDKIVTSTYTATYINGSCDDKNKIEVSTWYNYDSLKMGDVKINLITNSTGDYIYGNVSESITLKLNLLDDEDNVLNGDVNFAVRNYTGEILVKEDMAYSVSESAYVANYTFVRGAPYGFIEFNAYSSGEGYGGKFYYFKTAPYLLNQTINDSFETNHSYFLKDQLPINISYDNYYGEIISINTTMTIDYDNGSTNTSDLPLNMTDTYHVYNVPGDSPGNYTLTTTVHHSTGENKVYIKNIRVDGFYLKISTDPFWEAGDNITFSAWIEDRRGDPPVIVSSSSIFTLSTPAGQNTELTTVNTSEYKQRSYYQTSNTTSMGYYTIKVSSIDLYGHNYNSEYRFSIGGVYSNQFIEVNIPERFTINSSGNHSVNITVKNIKDQKLYDLHAHEENETDYLYVNMSDTDVDINASESTEILIIITPDDLQNGKYEEIIHIEINDNKIEVPVLFTIDLDPKAEVNNRCFDNTSFELTMFKDITAQEVVVLKNIGYRIMDAPKIYFLGNDIIGNVTAVQPASNLAINDTTNVVLKFDFDTPGTYEGELWVSSSNLPDQGYNITIHVLEGMISEVSVLSDRLALISNSRDILEFNATAKNFNLNFSTVDGMIINATTLRSYILSEYVDPENYEKIKDNITELEDMLSDIDDELIDIEKAYSLLLKPTSGDGTCDASESCSSSDCKTEKRCIIEQVEKEENVCGDSICSIEIGECETCPSDCGATAVCDALLNPDDRPANSGGFPVGIIIGVVVLLVIAAILATSLVPEEDGVTNQTSSGNGMSKMSDVLEKIQDSISGNKKNKV
ncbi:MAG: hypothetical protein GQ477_03565 [Nanohaloarchaea archaeon]|nr:hypothetical protein [Candidatus Nanohaloarchaea archaeon]